jgi:hypothetical protein
MTTLEIIPSKSIGPARLGMHWDDVPSQLGAPCHERVKKHKREVYLNAALVLDYNDDGFVETIAVTNCSKEMGYLPLLFSINPFDYKDEELLKFLSQYGSYDENDTELGYNYIYKDIGIYLWRDADPEQLIKEKQALDPSSSTYSEELEFYEKEIEEKRYFECVGVFVEGYFD